MSWRLVLAVDIKSRTASLRDKIHEFVKDDCVWTCRSIAIAPALDSASDCLAFSHFVELPGIDIASCVQS
jgi:hypothetical protein